MAARWQGCHRLTVMGHRYDEITLEELRARRSIKWRAFPSDVVPAWVAEMDFPLAEPITEALHALVDGGDTGYAYAGDLAEVYASYARQRDGFAADPAHTLVVADVLGGIRVSMDVLTAPGERVAFFVPSYPPFFHTIEAAGRQCAPVKMAYDHDTAKYDIDFAALDAVLADRSVTALLLCNPQNPTGRVFSRTNLERVAETADLHGVVVLSDEVHAPLTYNGSTHVPFASLGGDAAQRSVTFVSASKAWNVPGLKCALVIAGGHQPWAALQRAPKTASFGTSIMGIAANSAAFERGGPWLVDTMDYLSNNRTAFGELLAHHLPGARWSSQEATYLAWVDCNDLGLGDDPAKAFLERGKVAVNSGLDFGPEGAGFIRVNLATPRHILEEVVRRLAGSL